MFSNDLSIDLGTANTLIYVKGQGIVLDEPVCRGYPPGSSRLTKVLLLLVMRPNVCWVVPPAISQQSVR
ncbi:rod shape-determining protein [Shigella flexneri]